MIESKSQRYLFLIAIVVVGIALYSIVQQKKQVKQIDGATLFKPCSSCHKLDTEFTGPRLKGSLQRWGGDKKAMFDFIRNPAIAITRDAKAKKVFEKYNKTMMTAFPNLTDAELDAMMNYWERSTP